MEINEHSSLKDTVWKERVYMETAEFKIVGYVFMPKTGKKNRVLSDIMNSRKRFLAVKDCSLEFKLIPNKEVEHHDFLQVNIASILIMRPAYND